MNNPFESGHIKNYILLYASVVVIMILFFIASTLFNDVKKMEKKTFNTKTSEVLKSNQIESLVEENSLNSNIRLLEVNSKSYSEYHQDVKDNRL
jgi:hypothetical protein